MKIINGEVYDTSLADFAVRELCFTDIICDTYGGEVIDSRGCYVVPGYIDVHTHGRMGVDFMDENADFDTAAYSYARTGTTTVFPTVMTNPMDNILGSIKRIAKYAQGCPISFSGVHIEGPYISEKRPGCHDISQIRSFACGEVEKLIGCAEGLRVHFTVSPESEGGQELIKHCVRLGASVGIGHSDADFETCKKALSLGAVSFTHTFNAMRPLSHREPGCVGASLLTDAYSEFICDMFHVCPDVVRMGYKLKNKGKFVIVTDSLPPAGLPNGRYSLAGMPINVTGKVILTDDGTIAGSAVDMHSSVQRLMECCDISYGEALLCATAAPARQVGIYDECGSLDLGKRADILLVDKSDLKIKRVIAKGKTVFCE